MVKLLEDIPSATEHRPHQRRPMVTLAVTGVALVLAAAVGTILLLTGGGDDDRSGPPPAAANTEVALSEWVDGVSEACTQTAATRPILTQGAEARTDPANLVESDAATRDLAIAVRGVALPTNADDATTATDAVRLGDQADQAWYAVAALPADTVTPDRLTQASDATTAFVAKLTELGATGCADLS